jgi:hypothetical protein
MIRPAPHSTDPPAWHSQHEYTPLIKDQPKFSICRWAAKILLFSALGCAVLAFVWSALYMGGYVK